MKSRIYCIILYPRCKYSVRGVRLIRGNIARFSLLVCSMYILACRLASEDSSFFSDLYALLKLGNLTIVAFRLRTDCNE